MADLEERMHGLATALAAQARAPGAELARRQGRRRRRRLLATTTVVALALAAGGVELREVVWQATAAPVTPGPTPTTTMPAPFFSKPANGRVIAQGTQPGYPWRLVVERTPASNGFEVAWTFQRGDSFPDDDQMTAEEPVALALQVPSDTDPYPKVLGAVTERAARIRMTLARDGVPLAPVELRPIDGGVDIPANYFIAFAPGGTRLAELVLLDDRGATICGQRFDARPGHPPIYIDRAGDCMRLNGVR